jgi:hypothetical protein
MATAELGVKFEPVTVTDVPAEPLAGFRLIKAGGWGAGAPLCLRIM